MIVNHKQLQMEKNVQQRLPENGIIGGRHEIDSESVNCHTSILFARPVNQHSFMSLAVEQTEEESAATFDNIQHAVMLATLGEMKLCFSGEWVVETRSMSQVTTLFSFLDYQAKCRESNNDAIEAQRNVILHTDIHLALTVPDEHKTLMALFISSMLNPQDHCLESLFSFIRNVESYWISHFLLSQVMNEDKECDTHKIYNASRIYGVSESYFRKLCHRAFTRGPKKQLRLWRAANSALQLIENDQSIATIAGDNGYASSSHFSSEIKSLFGITPREFKKLEGLLHE
ncbi:helix-turn-helix domain-containing protein [Kluyvera intermedia]|uniref:helix-turn-helix domain-containing protein n=1 Tax=Kluyvera intermedia TaxID=61648 RepID=UPI00242F1FEE|nr:helix-turn-helix domain-containing protein [Kluyvera intermedia]WEJ85273.1 MAG: helix-turn-helix domain-containing protein [Kluyvera intermedia]